MEELLVGPGHDDPGETMRAFGAEDGVFAGPFMDRIGLRFDEVTVSRVRANWLATSDLHQPYGIVHGGVHASVVEALGSLGAAVWFGERGRCVGVSNHTEFFRPVTEGLLTSVAVPVHQGRTQQVWAVETHDDQGRLVSRGQLRVHNLTEWRPTA